MRILVLGHSQLPETVPNYEDHIVTSIRVPGASLWDLDKESSPLFQAWLKPADVAVIFLGGNDIFKHSLDEIKQKIESTIKLFQKHMSMVFFTLIEARDYSKHRNRAWRRQNDKYESCRKAINRKVRRGARLGKYRTVNLAVREFDKRTRDGVHYTPKGKDLMVKRFRVCVEKYIKEGK